MLRTVTQPQKQLFRQFSSQLPSADIKKIQRKKVTIDYLRKLKSDKVPIAMMTATDFPSARLCDIPYMKFNYENQIDEIEPVVDIVLVGDSLAMVELGYDNTIQLSLNDMIHHCKAVKRGIKSCFITADMPYGTYKISPRQALENAYKLISETNVDSVKIESGINEGVVEITRNLVRGGVPVMAHVGLTPQSYTLSSGYKVQGTTAEQAFQIYQDSLALQSAGAFSIVLECVPYKVSRVISRDIEIPTIGIGAGSSISKFSDQDDGSVNGQVLVQSDMLGIYGYNARKISTKSVEAKSSSQFQSVGMPKFCKQFASLGELTHEVITRYSYEVKAGIFPQNSQHGFNIEENEFNLFEELVYKLKQSQKI